MVVDSLGCCPSWDACDPLAVVSATFTPLIKFFVETDPASPRFYVATMHGPVTSRRYSVDRGSVRVRPSEDTSNSGTVSLMICIGLRRYPPSPSRLDSLGPQRC